jgi:hypothetical protein
VITHVAGLLSLNFRGRSLGGVFLLGPFPPPNFWGLSVANKPPQVLFRLLSIPVGAREWVSRHRSKSCDRGGLRFQLGAISGGDLISGGPNVWYLAAFASHTECTVVTLDRRFKAISNCGVLALSA